MKKNVPSIRDARVAAVFAAYPVALRARLRRLRELIFETAAVTRGVGKLEETLKWGQPSYLTRESGSGTTIRIDARREPTDEYAMYFHCQTQLINRFRTRYGRRFRYDGNRALLFNCADELPMDPLRTCIVEALTYHSAHKKPRVPIRQRIR